MRECGIHNNTTSGRETFRELDYAATETVSEDDTELKIEIEGEKISEQENDKHPMCHSV